MTTWPGCDIDAMLWGIEFEYLIVDRAGPQPGRVRDFGNLPFEHIGRLLDDKPGRGDPQLATGDLGIKSGYWYLEGDERFHPDGSFRTLEVKGVEIRTPPARGVGRAITRLIDIENQLAAVLAGHGLGLAIAGFNPVRPAYTFEPPLNAWEKALRAAHAAYNGSQVSTLSYG
ncbi:MAG: glutamate--cysteine ligase, partial [Zoogloea sp.]|nr:glutamate--cysteine ligase [Zoogloea sp.]